MSASNESLPALIQALTEPGRYPHAVAGVELIETHISYVLLAGDYAYKIKKPLDLGFLDFSSLDKRRFYCEEELRLNQRLAPDLYLDVVPIGGSATAPTLGGGDAIEYAVRMRRFPQSAQLDRMQAAGGLHASHVDAFAGLIAEFHAAAEVATADMPFGEPVAVYGPVEENFRALRTALTSETHAAQLDALERWSMSRFLGHRDQLAARKRAGRVRECHGDLHLRNLAWVDGQPLAFDCIEFAPELRWIDVLNEVAFLTMDLRARQEPALAHRFLNCYLEITGDYPGLALLPFYQVYRALVRAKVDAIRLGQADVGAEESEGIEAECGRYLQLARDFGAQRPPWLLITRGPSGSGKTTLTQSLVENFGAVRIRSDVERKRLHGLAARADARAVPGAGIYTPQASQRTYARLRELAVSLLAAGNPVIVDAVFADREQRAPFERLASDACVPFVILEFAASPAVLRERVARRERGASDADLAVLESQLAGWPALTPDESASRLVVDTERPTEVELLAKRVAERVQDD